MKRTMPFEFWLTVEKSGGVVCLSVQKCVQKCKCVTTVNSVCVWVNFWCGQISGNSNLETILDHWAKWHHLFIDKWFCLPWFSLFNYVEEMKPAFIFLSLSSNLEISFKVSIIIIYQHHFGSNNFSLIQNWKMRARDPKSKRYGRESPPLNRQGVPVRRFIFLLQTWWNGMGAHTPHAHSFVPVYTDLKKAVHLNALLSILGEKFQNRGFSNLFGWERRTGSSKRWIKI